jgi:hypothetical protein
MSESDDLALKFLHDRISGGSNLKDDAEKEEAIEWSYSMAAMFLKKKEEKAKQAREERAKKVQQPSSAADDMPRSPRRL